MTRLFGLGQAEKEDQEIAEACKRLIKNCIICWNYLYLSQKFAEIDDPVKREEFLKAVAHGSAATWEHVNLGRIRSVGGKIQRLGRTQAPDQLTGWSQWDLAELTESLGPQAIDDIPMGHNVPLLEFINLYRLSQVGENEGFAQFDGKSSICPFWDCHSSKEGRTRLSRISFIMSCKAIFRCWAGGTPRKNVSLLLFLLTTSESLASSSSPE